jgi:hypothetical protein
MSRYFEVVYPRRTKELKEKLDSIAERFDALDKSDDEGSMKLIIEFDKVFMNFLYNTKLHLKSEGNELADEKEIRFIMPEYFMELFGVRTTTARMFAAIQKAKEKEIIKGVRNGILESEKEGGTNESRGEIEKNTPV